MVSGESTRLYTEVTRFDPSDVEARCTSAGVIPVAVRPEDGSVVCLLGRERFVPNWKGSCRWSGMEGSRKPTESIEEAAAREFHEETLGVVADREALRRDVAAARFLLNVTVQVCHEHRAQPRYHSTYLVRVPYDEALPARFLARRGALERLFALVQEWNYVRPIAEHERCDRVEAGDEPGTAVFEVEGVAEERRHLRGEEARRALRWQELRAAILAAAKTVPEGTVFPSVDARWGELQSVRVSTDYLEKDQLRWWTLADLDGVMLERGRRGMEQFRPYFLPVLQTALDHLHAYGADAFEEADARMDPSLRK